MRQKVIHDMKNVQYKRMDIILWGVGQVAEHLLTHRASKYHVVACTDNNAIKWDTTFHGKPVVSTTECIALGRETNIPIVVAMTDVFRIADVAHQLYDADIHYIGILDNAYPIFGETDIWSKICFIDISKKPYLPYLETNIVDRCNLNCKACAHFANLFRDDDETETVEELKRDLEQISRYCHIGRFRLLGGEPLLASRLGEYIKVSRQYLPYTDLRIVTNGLLIPLLDELVFHHIREAGITMDISMYRPILERQAEIVRILEQNGIPYSFQEYTECFVRVMHLDGNQNPMKAYRNCLAAHCKFLRHGRLYTCPREALLYKYIENFKIVEFPLEYRDWGFDIFADSQDWNSIMQLSPSALCHFCDESGGEYIDWSTSPNPKKEDWIVYNPSQMS